MLTVDDIRNRGLVIYEYIRGSKLHNIATPLSDTDFGGVYIAPEEVLYGFENDYQPTISDARHDTTFFELRTWLTLLAKSNPNALEGLFAPDDFVVRKHPCIQPILDSARGFLTKQAFAPMLGYSYSQITKARGLNKKIVNPVEHKDVLDFCYIIETCGAVPVKKWLSDHDLNQKNCGLVNIPNARDAYALYYSISGEYNGIVSSGANESNEVRLSSIPKGRYPIATMSFNQDGYTSHCREYKEYNEWVAKRNPVRYQSNLNKNYDAKNVAECVRLIHMGIELASTGQYNVVRPQADREFLLDIKNHKYEYDEIMSYVTTKKSEMEMAMKSSTLPDSVDMDMVRRLLIDTRKNFYIWFDLKTQKSLASVDERSFIIH